MLEPVREKGYLAAAAGSTRSATAYSSVEVTGTPVRSDRDACRELGAVVAATIAPDR